MSYTFKYDKKIVNLVREIERLLERLGHTKMPTSIELYLRKSNELKTVSTTCQIEGNTLTGEDITKIINGFHVAGSENEIIEVENALRLYRGIDFYDPLKRSDFLGAHKALMEGLTKEAGKLRKVNVGIGGKTKMRYIAPRFEEVPDLVKEMFKELKDENYDQITMGILYHYMIETIHPFIDGNGRMGRFMQTLYHSRYVHPSLTFVSVESEIKNNQKEYYSSLNNSQNSEDATEFILFMLKLVITSLKNYLEEGKNTTSLERLKKAKKTLKNKSFSKKDYQDVIGAIASPTASRDLRDGVEAKILKKEGSGNQTKYKFLK
jgi:Fic family protein